MPNVALPTGLAIATFAAAIPWLYAFRVPAQAALLVAASSIPVAVTAVLAGSLRRPAALSYAVSAAGLAVLLAVASGLHFGSLGTQLVQVPDRLLTETLPLGSRSVVLAPVLVLTWLCGAGAAELAYRGNRKSAINGISLVVPVAFFVLAYAVAAGAPGGDRWAGGILLVALAVTALAGQLRLGSVAAEVVADSSIEAAFDAPGPQTRDLITRRRLAKGAWLAGTAALAIVLTAVVPSLGAFSGAPASFNEPAPVAHSVILDPLGTTASLRDGNPHAREFPVLRVTTDGPMTGYLAAAVLDNFDGSEWTFDSTFEPTGGRVPAATGARPKVGGEAVHLREAIESALPGGLLPALDRPVRVSGSPAAVDRGTGMILPRRVPPGSTFEVTSTAPAETLAGTPSVDGIDTSVAAPGRGLASPLLALPPDSAIAMSAALTFVARITSARPAPTVAFLQKTLGALRSQERQLSPYAAAPLGQNPQPGATTPSTAEGVGAGHLGGTSLSEVINAVTVDRSATPEQFATFFALIARDIGVPARIATGFRSAQGSAGVLVPAGTRELDNRQAWTWVEIPVSGIGWVVTDPTPDALTAAAAPPPEQAQAVPTTLPPSKANAVPKNAAGGGHAIAKPVPLGNRSSGGLPEWSLALVAAVGLVVLLSLLGAGVAAMRRYLRHRSRRSKDPALLAAGAWLELLDGLDRAGMRVEPGSTSSEIATDAARHFSAGVEPQVVEIAAVADRAIFSALHPPQLDDAFRAWQTQREVSRTVLRGLDRRQRARALITVGSSPRRPAP